MRSSMLPAKRFWLGTGLPPAEQAARSQESCASRCCRRCPVWVKLVRGLSVQAALSPGLSSQLCASPRVTELQSDVLSGPELTGENHAAAEVDFNGT